VSRLLTTLAALTLAAACAPAAASAALTPGSDVSANWAGYVAGATGATASSARFRSVQGRWVIPTPDCTATAPAATAIWVGLGGAGDSSQALEQTGTEVDCDTDGSVHASAWTELVPAAAVTAKLAVRPGDTMAAVVSVDGTTVTLRLRDVTTGQGLTRRSRMAAPDTTSAEWILEAPAECDSRGACQQLTLGAFAPLTFTGAVATSTDGRRGTIADAAWPTTALTLQEGTQRDDRWGPGRQLATTTSGATPSALSGAGATFAVTYQPRVTSTTAAPTMPGADGLPRP
jgi:hypothetical protein